MTKTPHDALFKSVFQQPENAAAELRHVLPDEHVAAIDWSTLKLEPGSYVDEALADQHSDLLFSATAQASGERVLVYLLFEHQSTAEPKMALRLLSYMVSIWERFSDDDKNKALPLPLSVPAVLSQVGRRLESGDAVLGAVLAEPRSAGGRGAAGLLVRR